MATIFAGLFYLLYDAESFKNSYVLKSYRPETSPPIHRTGRTYLMAALPIGGYFSAGAGEDCRLLDGRGFRRIVANCVVYGLGC